MGIRQKGRPSYIPITEMELLECKTSEFCESTSTQRLVVDSSNVPCGLHEYYDAKSPCIYEPDETGTDEFFYQMGRVVNFSIAPKKKIKISMECQISMKRGLGSFKNNYISGIGNFSIPFSCSAVSEHLIFT